MKLSHILIYLFIAFTSVMNAQVEYDTEYFRSPVNHTMYLSGTFGELRPNHFHAGIDIKAKNGKVGDAVYAAASGYAYRIKVSTGGYGRTLYLRHDNGLITVYAHLGKYAKSIEDYIKEEQYIVENFEIERFPEIDRFRFNKGDYIGKMGLTGRSYGPHLHFEIRNESEEPLNPLKFGLKINDSRSPIINEIKIYNLNDEKETISTKTFKVLKRKNGQYHLNKDTLVIGAWRTGIAIKTYDLMNSIKNWNGVYKVQMKVDDQETFSYTMDKISFDETRYINAHMDYAEQQNNKSYFNRCFTLPGNKLSIYDFDDSKGVIKLFKNKKQKITFEVEDVEGNSSSLTFWMKRGEVKPAIKKPYNYVLPREEESVISNTNTSIHFPKGSFYENIYLNLEEVDEKSNPLKSPVLSMKSEAPIHKYCKISIKPNEPVQKMNKYYVAKCNNKGSYEFCGHKVIGKNIEANIRKFGDYALLIDTIPPTIKKIYFRKSMVGSSYMRFKAHDDVSSIDYRAEVDGQWILMAYDPKKDILEYRFDKYVGSGKHQLILTVSDQNGNTTQLIEDFVR